MSGSIHDSSASATRDREYWRGVLLAGGFAALPRWTIAPAAGWGELDVVLPQPLAVALRRLADQLEVPVGVIVMAAHARVLGALTGEREVSIGYAPAPGGSALPLRLPTRFPRWREAILEVRRRECALWTHAAFPVDELMRELGVLRPPFETVFSSMSHYGGAVGDSAVLWAGIRDHDGLALRLRYRIDVLDAGAAGRIAGYHLVALELIAADPDAEPERQSLLSEEELRFQREDLAGPSFALPNGAVHEMFEERARAHPDAVAVVHRGTPWSYGELNGRANRLARALSARGLRREEVVAVVSERNASWIAAVLGIFKAGGAYLPIEPRFPAERVARILSRAGCRLVLAERGSTATLDRALPALPETQTLFIDAACDEDHPSGDLGRRVAPDQLAYIYFTSGSTGEPKGAMCEHAGMLNHVLAKIRDLGIGDGQVVAQTAPQCFDISLWQILAPLAAGGRIVVVEQEAILDAPRFFRTIRTGGVNVIQVVPSYLEVLVSLLETQPRSALPYLRCVCVTGEALTRDLVRRWFSVAPGVTLVNAYGLTETSDDTNHEVMAGVPDGERVPLGRPIPNVQVAVVDEHLSPVPLGAPGELVFSGVCVGRGYVGDPERTRESFLPDPSRAGGRLYRSGDYGRWMPDGKLEFLGRRDAQVKLSGFRIEIGEIESAMSRVPGVRLGAVVVITRADRGQHLVAFYSGPRPLDSGTLKDRLIESLPVYMVPSAFHWREDLPLTENGKIDRSALIALGRELAAAEQDGGVPTTATERRLAAAWAEVLGVPRDRIGPGDHFFDLGGTSLSGVRLGIALEREVSIKDLSGHPILRDLAALIDGRAERRAAGREEGERDAVVPLNGPAA